MTKTDFDAITYWEWRYRESNRGSGPGSERKQADHKAGYLNLLIEREHVLSVIDWGCGDGRVISRVRARIYLGLDVSESALRLCQATCGERSRWSWALFDGFTAPPLPPADLSLSLDVIFHLVDDAMYRRHLELVFGAADLVCIQSSNRDENGYPHVRHREFLKDVPQGWSIVDRPDPEWESEIGLWVFRREEGE
jgi:SAM-dependent methyltransferase